MYAGRLFLVQFYPVFKDLKKFRNREVAALFLNISLHFVYVFGSLCYIVLSSLCHVLVCYL